MTTNRTIVELKQFNFRRNNLTMKTTNRTIVELKQKEIEAEFNKWGYYQSYHSGIETSFEVCTHENYPVTTNRTIVELKPNKTRIMLTGMVLPIVP